MYKASIKTQTKTEGLQQKGRPRNECSKSEKPTEIKETEEKK